MLPIPKSTSFWWTDFTEHSDWREHDLEWLGEELSKDASTSTTWLTSSELLELRKSPLFIMPCNKAADNTHAPVFVSRILMRGFSRLYKDIEAQQIESKGCDYDFISDWYDFLFVRRPATTVLSQKVFLVNSDPTWMKVKEGGRDNVWAASLIFFQWLISGKMEAFLVETPTGNKKQLLLSMAEILGAPLFRKAVLDKYDLDIATLYPPPVLSSLTSGVSGEHQNLPAETTCPPIVSRRAITPSPESGTSSEVSDLEKFVEAATKVVKTSPFSELISLLGKLSNEIHMDDRPQQIAKLRQLTHKYNSLLLLKTSHSKLDTYAMAAQVLVAKCLVNGLGQLQSLRMMRVIRTNENHTISKRRDRWRLLQSKLRRMSCCSFSSNISDEREESGHHRDGKSQIVNSPVEPRVNGDNQTAILTRPPESTGCNPNSKMENESRKICRIRASVNPSRGRRRFLFPSGHGMGNVSSSPDFARLQHQPRSSRRGPTSVMKIKNQVTLDMGRYVERNARLGRSNAKPTGLEGSQSIDTDDRSSEFTDEGVPCLKPHLGHNWAEQGQPNNISEQRIQYK